MRKEEEKFYKVAVSLYNEAESGFWAEKRKGVNPLDCMETPAYFVGYTDAVLNVLNVIEREVLGKTWISTGYETGAEFDEAFEAGKKSEIIDRLNRIKDGWWIEQEEQK